MHRRLLLAACLALLAVTASACDAFYYKAMRRIGMEKRDILVNRVKDARKSQVEAKEQFKDALEKFKSVIDVEGGELEEKYNRLEKELNRADDRANEVRDRIKSVRDVSDDLFKEWDKELKQYADRRLRNESERELKATRQRCAALIESMSRAQKRIDPVLTPLRDRVLFLKHNLNAKAIGALDAELTAVRTNVDDLIADLDRAIAEADRFVASMDQGS
jgi:chromosome segregation ATPase